jgi:hypothetical protein
MSAKWKEECHDPLCPSNTNEAAAKVADRPFDEIRFTYGMSAIYLGVRYRIIAVNFPEELLGLELDGDELSWVRAENTKILDADLSTPKAKAV